MHHELTAVNLTQHPATPEQLAAGIYDPTPEERDLIVKLLTFEECPDTHEIEDRAAELALEAYAIVHRHIRETMSEEEQMAIVRGGYGSFNMNAMIGGAPYLMSALEKALVDYGVCPYYAFSRRESVEETMPDGSVRKTAVFRHAGFIQMA